MNCGGLHVADNCQVKMGYFSKTSFQVQTGINPEKACMRDHSFLIFIISKCSRAAVLDFRKAKLSQFRKEHRNSYHQREYLYEQDSAPIEQHAARGLIKVTSTENKTEETYYLIKLR